MGGVPPHFYFSPTGAEQRDSDAQRGQGISPPSKQQGYLVLIIESFGKLFTESGEIIAEGSCQIDMDRGSVTMRPVIDTPLITRHQGPMHLVLDDGTSYKVRPGIIKFNLNVPGNPPGPAYRMFVTNGNGTPAADREATG